MGALRGTAKLLLGLGLALCALAPGAAVANPMITPIEIGRQVIIFGLLCLYIVLVEGAVIKFVLFGLDGPSWPRALLLAALLNLLSGVAGNLSGVYFDWLHFKFDPNVETVFGISLGVEGYVLVLFTLLFAWRKAPRALVTVLAMNVASYLILILSRLPKGFPLPFQGMVGALDWI